jgi:hypothetical protein
MTPPAPTADSVTTILVFRGAGLQARRGDCGLAQGGMRQRGKFFCQTSANLSIQLIPHNAHARGVPPLRASPGIPPPPLHAHDGCGVASAMRARPAAVFGPVDSPPWKRHLRLPGSTFRRELPAVKPNAQFLAGNRWKIGVLVARRDRKHPQPMDAQKPVIPPRLRTRGNVVTIPIGQSEHRAACRVAIDE